MKKGLRPITRSANPEPQDKNSISWIIWAAWADRITFEDIKEITGRSESEVIKIMRRNLSESSFRLWRKRIHNQSIKHRKKFENSRKQLNQRIYFSDDD
ncbi:MAG: TIGR03643 family protein [Candidatus Fonsibacter sp.]